MTQVYRLYVLESRKERDVDTLKQDLPLILEPRSAPYVEFSIRTITVYFKAFSRVLGHN